MRLDIYLKENKNIKSRARAKLLVEDSRVKINSKIVLSASYNVKELDMVEVEDMKYVSRAGYKLEYAFTYLNSRLNNKPENNLENQDRKETQEKSFDISNKLEIKNKICLDIGSSTGGFTDYLIQNGASEVFSVDVGSNQFDQELLKNNENKIKLFENTDIRSTNFTESEKDNAINKSFDIIVCDVSFISLTHIMPSIEKYLSGDGFGVILFKPQFEVGIGNTKKGIVKDVKLVEKVKQERILDFANIRIKVIDVFESGILGGDGNIEYIFYIRKN